MIRAISDQDYDKVLRLSEYAFQFTEAKYNWEEAKRKLDKQYILGDFEDDNLLAKLHIYYLDVMIKNKG